MIPGNSGDSMSIYDGNEDAMKRHEDNYHTINPVLCIPNVRGINRYEWPEEGTKHGVSIGHFDIGEHLNSAFPRSSVTGENRSKYAEMEDTMVRYLIESQP